jgi:lipoprotein NlpI
MLRESTEIVADLKNKTIEMNDKFKSLDVYLDTQPKDQKQSSEVLKRTFKELSQ